MSANRSLNEGRLQPDDQLRHEQEVRLRHAAASRWAHACAARRKAERNYRARAASRGGRGHA